MNTLEDVQNFLKNHPSQLRQFANNELILVLLPTNLKAHTLAALQSIQDINIQKNPVLACYYEGDNPSVQTWRDFEFFALEHQADLCTKLAANHSAVCQLSEINQRKVLSSLGEINQTSQHHHLINDLLNKVLIYSRPLRHYGCSFYLPIYYDKPLQPNLVFHDVTIKSRSYDENSSPEQAQAYFYFQPSVRDYLFDSKENQNLTPVREWYLDFDTANPWQLNLNTDRGEKFDSHVLGVTLYQYFNYLCMLVIEVKPAAIAQLVNTSLFLDNETGWHDLAFSDQTTWENIESLQLAHWLRFTKLARILFPSFVEQKNEGKIATVILKDAQNNLLSESKNESRTLAIEPLENHVSGVIQDFLVGFLGTSKIPFNQHYHQFYDDRMFVNVAYGYAGHKIPKPADLDKLFSLALYVDDLDSVFDCLGGYAYDVDFIQNLTREQSYSRWQSLVTYSGYTNYSNVYLGNSWTFCNIIAKNHVPYLYGRMLLITLFYQASLRYYNRRIMEFTDKLRQENVTNSLLEEMQNLRRDFIRFTNVYWFHDLTSQQQGQEVFKKQQNALELKREYEMLKDEMERLDEFLQARFNVKTTEQATDLNNLVSLFTIVAVFLAAVQLGVDVPKETTFIDNLRWLSIPIAIAALWLGYIKQHHLKQLFKN